MSSDLVAYIRKQKEWCSRLMSGGDWFAIDPDDAPFRAADRIEALEGEKQGWVEAEAQYLADMAVLVARAERLRVAIYEALNNLQDRVDNDCECLDCQHTHPSAVATLTKALEDDKQ